MVLWPQQGSFWKGVATREHRYPHWAPALILPLEPMAKQFRLTTSLCHSFLLGQQPGATAGKIGSSPHLIRQLQLCPTTLLCQESYVQGAGHRDLESPWGGRARCPGQLQSHRVWGTHKPYPQGHTPSLFLYSSSRLSRRPLSLRTGGSHWDSVPKDGLTWTPVSTLPSSSCSHHLQHGAREAVQGNLHRCHPHAPPTSA